MQKATSNIPPVDFKSLSSEDRQLFGKYVQNLLLQNKWISLDEAQRQAYKMLCDKGLEGIDLLSPEEMSFSQSP